MVEQVEAAIANSRGRDPIAYRGYYREAARAAIAVMREPSQQMIDKGGGAICEWSDPDGTQYDEAARSAWQTMIDTALGEDK